MTSASVLKAYANTATGQIHYRFVDGPGIPLVMYHRSPATSQSFVPMMELLAGERAVYAFDLPGFGMSFEPPGSPTAGDYAEWLLAALDVLGLARVHIFAHHTGTHFSTEMAARYPERVASLMLNGIAYLTAAERAKLAAAVMEPEAPGPDGKYIVATAERMATLLPAFDPSLFHIELTSALQSHFSRHKSFHAVWGQDYPAALAKVKCPILATSSENEYWRFCFDRVFEGRPDAKRVMLGPAKFFTPELDAPATVAAIRAFLNAIGG